MTRNDSAVLLGALLKSTSQWNIYRYCKDKKKKGKVVGNTIGMSVLYLMLIAYGVFMCIGYGMIGLTDVIPGLCALTIALLAFLFTFFKTNGYLFNFKEYDMLMSLPFSSKTVAGCKFLYMYIKSLPWYVSISLAMLIGYGIYAHPAIYIYPLWMILSLFLPVIPMLLASFFGFIVTRISAGFRKNNLIQTILTFILILFLMSLRFIIEYLFRNDEMADTLEAAADALNKAVSIYLPAKWFADSMTKSSIVSMLLLAGVSILLFELLFYFVGRSYREINSKLKSHAASKKASLTGRKKKSVLNTIAFKEFRRMLGSTTYMTNVAIGDIFAVIAGIAALFVNIDKLIETALMGAPVTKEMLYPAIPLIIYFFIGMAATTAMTPSLEGKNYWIVQSLPLTKKKLIQGKMLFNMYFTVPVMLFGVLCVCISSKAPVLTTLLSLILGFTLCCFSTTWGAVCGLKYMKLDWENEVEVVKQGAAMSIYLLPNMFATMALIALSVFLGTRIDQNFIIGVLILISALLSLLCYRKALRS